MNASPAALTTSRSAMSACFSDEDGDTLAMNEANVPNATPRVEPVQELRLAVVLYGGVSLAIYIAGVVRELHRLVRVTACAGPHGGPVRWADTDLDPGERAYRALARLLGRQESDGDHGPLRTRFVIDAISGTSAGGINGAFLAKALANDQRLDSLRRLWLDKGDLGRLLDRSDRPESLLDSAQMYADLLEAFDQLDRDQAKPPPDGWDIDCYLTATDLAGRDEPLPLNEDVLERRHRHVFRFSSHAGESGDFAAAGNPLLAFAARCTSSFPVAFTPMTFADCADRALARGCDDLRLRRLFHRWRHHEAADQDRDRSFGDGGYLDNKPFSYVVERLGRRHAPLPVRRSLIYVEPVPETVDDPTAAERPDAIANAKAALLDLPRREGIRGDLETIVAHNRLATAALALTRGIEKDVARSQAITALDTATWRGLDLRASMDRMGAAYGVYHRLKVQCVLAWLADLAARLAGFSETSAERDGLLILLDRWRSRTWCEFHDGRPTENDFLLRFDLPYRERRLVHCSRLLGDLAFADRERREDLGEAMDDRALIDEVGVGAAALALRADLAEVLADLDAGRRRLRSSEDNPASAALAGLGGDHADLIRLARSRSTAERDALLESLLGKHAQGLTTFTDAVDAHLHHLFAGQAIRISALTAQAGEGVAIRVAAGLRRLLNLFEAHDQVLFPIQWGTSLAEMTPVDVVRISPADAPGLIDEAKDAGGRRKLAGTALGNFGAFLDRRWRRNDYLWGRLDASERLIRTLVPDDRATADRLIAQAHEAIIAEEFGGEDRERLSAEVTRHLLAEGVPVQDLGRGEGRHAAAAALLRHLAGSAELRRHLAGSYEVDRDLPTGQVLTLAGRSAETAGRLLRTLSDHYPLLAGPAGWILRLSRILVVGIRLSLPGSVAQALTLRVLVLVYLAEALVLVGGLIFVDDAIVFLGLRLLVLTLAAHLGLALLGEVLRQGMPGGRRLLRWGLALIGLASLALLVLIGAQGIATILRQVPGLRGLVEGG